MKVMMFVVMKSTDVPKPPTAEALVYGILQLQKKIRRTSTIAR